MTLVYPEGTPTLGNTKVAILASAPADLTAIGLAADIGAATTVDASLHLYPAGWAPTATTNKGEKPARLGSKRTLQTFNRTAFDLGDLQYVHDPQEVDSAAGNEVRELLQPGAKVVIVERQGLDAEDDAFAVGDHYIAHYVEVNEQIRSGDRTDENGEFFITQSAIYVNDGPVYGVLAA